MIKGIFSLPLPALQGFVDSIFELLDVPLTSPAYTCINKRLKTVQVKYHNKSRGAIRHIAIDSTGLKVFGDGEWKVKKHGAEKCRPWRKLHLDVDVDTHEAISAEISLVNEGDSEVLSTCLTHYAERSLPYLLMEHMAQKIATILRKIKAVLR